MRRVELRSPEHSGRPLSLWGAVAICFGAGLVLSVLISSAVLQPGTAGAAFAILVALISYLTTVPAAVTTAGLAFLFEQGFLYDTRGVLGWHGTEDLIRLTGLLVLAITVSILGRWLAGSRPSHRTSGDE
ncbi:MAG: hypothetical protein Q8L05_09720 [Actinomycetota bacterium]|nr:hypothetical protein [Actinomycetota bacterium]MDP2287661.1 hypothetical protein [Actinomycetota bacterium]